MQFDPKTLRGNWNYPTQMRFGPGRVAELPDACQSLGMRSPLLITDPGLAALPMISKMIEACRSQGLRIGLFSDVKANPVGENVTAGVEVYREGGHDGVVAVGGGSGLDAAKAVALLAGQDRPLWDFEDRGDNWLRAKSEAIPPIIAVPTTAGTGSEVGRASVITDAANHTKKIIFHPRMMPSLVISDPELTLGLPRHVTAATGMDALAHCFEAYCAPGFHPMADGIAVEGIRLVKDWLPRAVVDGKDLAARAHMLAAASMGATAFQKGLGAIHSLSHPVGAIFDTHHGLTNAVFMPYVMVLNRPAIGDAMVRLGAFLELERPSFESVMEWVLTLRNDLEIPHKLSDLGVEESRLEEIAAMAVEDPTAPTNPIPLTRANMLGVLDAAMNGRL